MDPFLTVVVVPVSALAVLAGFRIAVVFIVPRLQSRRAVLVAAGVGMIVFVALSWITHFVDSAMWVPLIALAAMILAGALRVLSYAWSF
ncbi:MAG: hypothetical protein Q8R35_00655 [bacterium]|nr:hypothetical protein [bacterium]